MKLHILAASTAVAAILSCNAAMSADLRTTIPADPATLVTRIGVELNTFYKGGLAGHPYKRNWPRDHYAL